MRAANIEKWEELRISDPEEYMRLTAQRDELHKKLELGPFGKKMLDSFQASLLIAFLIGWMEYYHVWEDLGIKQKLAATRLAATELFEELKNKVP